MVRVEFYGIPRQRTGVDVATAAGNTLHEVLLDLAARYPKMADECLEGGWLRAGYTASVNGARFVTAGDTPLAADDCVLIMSVDVGG